MEKRSGGRTTRASSKSPSRQKASRTKSKSPGRRKSPGRPKSPAPPKSKSPGRNKSPAPPISKSPGRPKKSPEKKVSPIRNVSPLRKISPIRKYGSSKPENSLKEKEIRVSPFVRLEKPQSLRPSPAPLETLRNEGREAEVEVLFVDDNIRYKTSATNVKFGGPLNVGDLRQVRWEDGNYYDARILNILEISRERSISLPKASTSSQITSRVYSEETLVRRSSRLKQNEQLDKIKNVMNADMDKILKANNAPLPPQYERKFGEKPVREFGNWPGAFLTILVLPVLALVLQMSCTKSKCSGLMIPSVNWRVYLDLHTAGYYLSYVIWQALLSSLPLARQASYGHVHARLSGFYDALLTFAVVGGLYYYGFNVTSVLGKSVALLSSAVIFGILFALVLFVKGGRTNTGRNINADGNKVYDFFIGREIIPTVGPLNIKAMLIRMELIGILLLDSLYLLKYIETHAAGVHSPTLLFTVIAHTLYVLDALWFEEKFMTSFEAQYEGVGYMSVMAAAVWPFLFTLATRYIVYTGFEAPTYQLVFCGIVFTIGYFIYRASNSQKAEFRKNPQHPVFAKYETISTFHGKRLLCGGWWGILRHPNYLGDIMLMWSVAAVCGLSHWLPYVFSALHSAILIHRTFRVSARCKGLYGAAWDRYTQLVKYRLVPRVF